MMSAQRWQVLVSSLTKYSEYHKLGLQGAWEPLNNSYYSQLGEAKDPVFLFLMETKIDTKKMENICVVMGFQHAFIVPSKNRSGGLALLWKDNMQVRVRTYSQHHIDVHVYMDSNSWCWLSSFYGHPKTTKSRETWKLLKHLANMAQSPWVCVRDFNEILVQEEKQGVQEQSLQQMLQFREALGECSLTSRVCRTSVHLAQ